MKVKKINDLAVIPKYQTKGSAGFDLHSVDEVTIMPNETRLIGTGLAFEVPEGYELQIRPRSGLSLKSGLRIANSPGTIDSDYRGEVGLIIYNSGNSPFGIKIGDRLAQGVVNKIEIINFEVVNELTETVRNDKGFGSTNAEIT